MILALGQQTGSTGDAPMCAFVRGGVLALVLIITSSASAQDRPSASAARSDTATRPAESETAEAPAYFQLDYSGDLWTRPALTGDWGGARSELTRKGISFNVETLQFLQGNAHGGKDTSNAFRYTGSVDYTLQLDTGRMGLWPGGYVKVRGETLFAESINSKVDAVSAVNFDALFPDADQGGATTLTEFWYLQSLLENRLLLFGGKIDTTRLPGQNVFTADPYGQFMNLALFQIPILGATIPYSTMAAGASAQLTDWLGFSTLVFDSHGSATRTGFDTGFHSPRGVTFLQQLTFTIKPFELPGHQRFMFAYSTREDTLLTDTDDGQLNLPLAQPPGPLQPLFNRASERRAQSGDWAFVYDFDQYLYLTPDDPDQGFGLFGTFGVSRGETNPIAQYYKIGFGGKGVIPNRPRDRYGVGYYYTKLSDDIPDRFNLNVEQGIEVFYNIEVTPWLHITPDLQVIMNPGGLSSRDVAIVYGLRAQMSF